MLYGSYLHTIDKKGRISIPSRLRDQLGNEFVVCKGFLGKTNLCVYSLAEWDKLVAKIATLPNTKSGDAKRFLYSGTFNVECDAQGRILIPPTLREYACLEGEAQIIGMDNNLEIWNTALWEKENERLTPESIASIMEELNF